MKKTTILKHGSNHLFDEFKISPELSPREESVLAEGYGIYMIEDKAFASSYGENIYTIEVCNEDITDFTSKKEIRKVIETVSKSVNVDFYEYMDVEILINSILAGTVSVVKLYKEISDMLDSTTEEFHMLGIVTYEEDCIYSKIEKAYLNTIKDVIKYYDQSFKKSVYICFRNPEVLKIISVEKK